MNIWKETKEIFSETGQHFRTGVSFMLPILLIGGLIGSLAVFGGDSEHGFWVLMRMIGDIGLTYFVPIMAAYVAYSMADNSGIAPGFIIGVIAQQTDSGYLGALIGALLVGYLTIMLLKIKLPEIIASTWGMLAPVISTFIIALFMFFIIGPPIKILMEATGEFLMSLGSEGGAIMGLVLGFLGGVDFGGPFSKTASTFATAVIDLDLYTPLGICGAIVTVPPLGMCLAVLIRPKLYTKSERTYAKSSWLYAVIGGFTEIVIPLAVNDLLRVTISTVAGSMVTGLIAGIFLLELYTPILGIPQWFFYNKPLVYAISVISGIIVTAVLVNILKSRKPEIKEES